jgi:hypothetical protein
MNTFSDTQGRSWTVEVNVAALKRVRSLAGVDLLEAVEGSGLVERLMRDPVLLCDVVYALCKPEADQRGVSDEDFGRAMAGDPIDHATAAVLDGLVSFCPSPRDRAALGRVLDATRRVREKARDLADQRLEALTSEASLDRIVSETMPALDHHVPAMSGGSSTSSPASSGSTRGP